MFKFKSIKMKQMFMVGLAIILSFAITISVITTKTTKLVEDVAYTEAKEMAKHYGTKMKAELEIAMDTARTLAQSLEGVKKSKATSREIINEVFKNVLEENPTFLGIWTIWEPNAFDGRDAEYANTLGHDETGRYIPYFTEKGIEALVDYKTADYYELPKQLREEVIVEPLTYNIDGKDVLMTSLVVPIEVGGEFLGVVGVDIVLDTIQNMIEGIIPFGTGYVAVVSHDGKYVAHPDTEKIGQDIGNTEVRIEMKEAIKKGEDYRKTLESTTLNKEVFRYLASINIGNTKTPWSFVASVPIEDIEKKAHEIRDYTIIMAIIAVLIIMALLYFITRNIVKPIIKTSETLKDIAEGDGDLTKRIKVTTDDEVGELGKNFNLFVDKIQELVSQIKYNSESLAESSSQISIAMEHSNQGMEEISSGLGSIADGSQNNASIVEESTASIAEISNNSDSITSEAENAFTSGKSIVKAAHIGTKNIEEVVKANGKVVTSTNEVYTSIKELKDTSDEVGQIVTMITSISEQINLLALNAAIEAARAGEQGRGFAVVAEEIRKLAEDSKTSSSQINALVDKIQTKANNANVAIIEGQEAVKESEDKTNIINEYFSTIVNSIEDITGKIEVITDSAKLQSQITDEMEKAMDEISSSTQNSASAVQQISSSVEEQVSTFEEINASVEELSNVAQILKEATDRFKI